ncbi:SH3 domain-binding glutamic acid-rich-like protein, partial [Spheniscus humboldti]
LILFAFFPPPPLLLQIKKQQQDVLGFLEANKIEFEEKDIAANEENRKWMRENVPEDSRPASGNPLPPRLFNDSRYLGDYEAFFEARENNAVYAFLGLTAPPGSKVGVYISHSKP